MKKIFFTIILTICISTIIFSQSNIPKQQNGSSKEFISSLKQINIINKINSFEDDLKILKIQNENSQKLLDLATKYIDWSGWIGSLITVLLALFAIFNYFDIKNFKKEFIEEKNKVFNDLDVTKKNINDFISNPQHIHESFEKTIFEYITNEIDNPDSLVFREAISKAFLLSIERKNILAKKIKSKLFDPQYNEFFFDIYNFVIIYDSNNKSTLSIDVLDFIPKDTPWGFYPFIINNIFDTKPYKIEPIDLYYRIKDHTIKTQVSHYLLGFLNASDSYKLFNDIIEKKEIKIDIIFFEGLIQKFISDNELVIDHIELLDKINDRLLRDAYIKNIIVLLSNDDIKSILNKYFTDDYNIEIDQLIKRIPKVDLTEFIANIYDNIPTEKRKNILNYINFNDKIAEYIIKQNGLTNDDYLLKSFDKKEDFKKLVNLCNLTNEDDWIFLLHIFHFDKQRRTLIQEVLNEVYNEVKNTLPQNDFFQEALPELVKPNFGIIKKDEKYFYKNIIISNTNEKIFNYKTKKIENYISHPILNFRLFISEL